MRVTLGKTRSGKTRGTAFQVLSKLHNLLNDMTVVVIDPQNDLASLLVEHSQVRFAVDVIAESERVPQFINLGDTGNKKENDWRREFIEQVFMGYRDLDPFMNPLIGKYLTWGLKMVQFSGSPLYWLPYCYEPWCDGFWWMKERCSDRATENLAYSVTHFSRHDQRIELEPANRLVTPICEDLSFAMRCGGEGATELLDANRLVVVIGDGATDRAIQIVGQFWINTVIDYVRKHRKPVLLVIDEANAWNLVTRDTLRAVCSMAKYGLDLWLMFQSIELLPEDAWEVMTNNCERFECYSVGGEETPRRAAMLLGTPIFDSHKRHHEDETVRQFHAGYDEDGKAVYEKAIDRREHYWTASDQFAQIAKDLATLDVGDRYVRDMFGVREERAGWLPDPFYGSTACQKIEEALQKYQTHALTVPARRRGGSESSNGSASTRPPTGNSRKRGFSKAMKPRGGASRDGQNKGGQSA